MIILALLALFGYLVWKKKIIYATITLVAAIVLGVISFFINNPQFLL